MLRSLYNLLDISKFEKSVILRKKNRTYQDINKFFLYKNKTKNIVREVNQYVCYDQKSLKR